MTPQVLVVARPQAGWTVAAVLRAHLGLSWSAARRLVEQRRVRFAGAACLDPAQRVAAGQRLEVHAAPLRQKNGRAGQGKQRGPDQKPPLPKARRPQTTGPRPVIVFAGPHLVVVDKPAGLTTVRHAHEAAEFGARGRRFLPPTLADLLPDLLADGRPGPRPRVRAVHRLDKETSGLVVFARTAAAERHLGRQFRAHTTERRYLAVVRGRAVAERIETRLVEDRGDGRRGSTDAPTGGQRAVTHVEVVEDLGDFTLVQCRLETGRTHQVRIHLGERGTPLCGERIYDRPPHGAPLPDGSGAARPALHAASLVLDHPVTGQRLHWTAPLPADLRELVARLRRHKNGGGPA
jgi:23S rRNA pseudouridine1911/1915/1917 synthase